MGGGGAGEVDDAEVGLAVRGVEPGAAPDDLLELRTPADDPRQHDVLHHLRIDPGGQQLRGGEDDRRAAVHVLEVRQMQFADLAFVTRDTADIVLVVRQGRDVAVEVVQLLAHLGRVVLIDAEHDRLGETVRALQVARQVRRYCLGARAQRDHPLEILGLVLAVRNLPAMAVELPLRWPPACRVHVRDHPMHAVRGQKAVLDALLQAVGVDRIPEVVVGVPRFLALRRRGHAE